METNFDQPQPQQRSTPLNQPWHDHNDTTALAVPTAKNLDDDAMDVNPNPSDDKISHLVRSLWPPLSCIVQSGWIASQPILYCDICRLIRNLRKQVNHDGKNDDDHDKSNKKAATLLSTEAYQFFKVFLVPSVSLFPANPAISTELWSILDCFPYRVGLEQRG